MSEPQTRYYTMAALMKVVLDAATDAIAAGLSPRDTAEVLRGLAELVEEETR